MATGGERTCQECGAALVADAPEGLCPKCLLAAALGTESGTGRASDVPGRSTAADSLPEPAALAGYFPQLEILELLGRGGMGAVYKARQPALDRLVALKILPVQRENEAFAERFNREARALARLSHPSIVAVYEFGQTHGLHYFVMEYVDGANLRRLEQTGKLTPRQALEIIPQICVALQYAHDEGVVHRDIKPENVLVDKKGRVKIADFGLAKILGRDTQDLRLTGARDVMGTPHYMAPEQVEHPQDVDHRADIYSLGVVFYEMLTGELPLGRFPPPSRKVQVDVRLDEVVLHALEKEPERRYQQASQVKTDVETIASGAARGSDCLTAAGASRVALGKRSRPGLLGFRTSAAATAVLLVAAAALVLARNGLPPFSQVKARIMSQTHAGGVVESDIPPVAIRTIPESGAPDVDPALSELRVTFSKPMQDQSWSWSTCGPDNYPEMTGPPRYLADGRTCVLPVKLQPGRLYALWLNSDKFQNFQDRTGHAALPYLLIFQTRN